MGCAMNTIKLFKTAAAIATVIAATTFASTASANPFLLFGQPSQPNEPQQVERTIPGLEESTEAPVRLRRQIVDYRTSEAPGTVIIDTPNTYLYLVLGNGKAMRYGI